MIRTVVLVIVAALSLALFAHETRIERECLAYRSDWPAETMTCVRWGGWYSR